MGVKTLLLVLCLVGLLVCVTHQQEDRELSPEELLFGEFLQPQPQPNKGEETVKTEKKPQQQTSKEQTQHNQNLAYEYAQQQAQKYAQQQEQQPTDQNVDQETNENNRKLAYEYAAQQTQKAQQQQTQPQQEQEPTADQETNENNRRLAYEYAQQQATKFAQQQPQQAHFPTGFTTTTALEGDSEEQALMLYSKAIKLGLRFIDTNDESLLKEAKSNIERAIVTQPTFSDALLVKGILLLIKKDYAGAKEVFQTVRRTKVAASLKNEATALLGYTEELSGNLDAARKALKPLFYNLTAHGAKKFDNVLTHQLLVDNYHFLPDWNHVHTYKKNSKFLVKLIGFNELYKRLQLTNWNVPNEFSWKSYKDESRKVEDDDKSPTDDDVILRKRAARLSEKYKATLRAGPNVDLNRGNMSEARKILFEKEAVQLRGVLQPIETRILWDYYNEMVKVKAVSHDDYLHRYVANNDRIGYWLLHKFKDFAEALSGELLKPSYTYLSYYQNPTNTPTANANLRPHTDKADNHITFSFQLKINPNPAVPQEDSNEALTWPLWVWKGTVDPISSWHERPNLAESVSFQLVEGDALAFKGRTHIHWRDAMQSSISNSTTILLHYVPLDMDYEDFVRSGR